MVDSKHYETLRFLAQEYLAIKGMPEEMPIWDSTEKGKMPIGLKLHSEGFNQALHLCKLAMVKEVPSEKLLLEEYIPEVYCDVIPDAKEVYAIREIDGQLVKYKLRMDNGKDLATAIHKLYLEKLGIKEE
jgi:hypothetical protein